ncbi:YifB family Mg chelatase-like AAA ATPase [Thioflexithrix psekupsensis]|uniref:ATP-dependent protease n=1 Tax=Thioflexithrix psekupsensis TaxID=1570016 RepID=A0A251X4T9_9GAMM|nr:YifB family Mg chelatase-like AAA ATPase [Thioflexithrix psekupsensis]OUD12523.1 ATP-dependent protease [Thioflexithrix psekupsensis]
MSLAVVYSRAQVGIEAIPVTIEVHLTGGLPSLSIVGLPETAVKESKDRVRSALLNSDYYFPVKRITINLAPADLPKEGGRFDLAIAIGILAASGQLPRESLHHYEFVGELALGGELRPIRGVLPVALAVRNVERALVVPMDNADEASIVHHLDIFPCRTLFDICQHLQEVKLISPRRTHALPTINPSRFAPDLNEVRGQHQARRALEVAAAGGHNLLMLGPPGTGKTMLASRLPSILPPMTEQEALETAVLQSVGSSAGFQVESWGERPFRTPHHTASGVALVGGGSHPRPGEISLAHNGVLFLDELPEFDKKVLEVLRQPLESRQILISRAARQAQFPANFQLVAAMNPCPCGYLGDPSGRCQCSTEQVKRYRSRLSGPLLDRIDLHVEVPHLPRQDMRLEARSETSAVVRERVLSARERQLQRCHKPNSHLNHQEIEAFCRLNEPDERLLDTAIERLGLSARAWHRILRVARTIADLSCSDSIKTQHLTEAITYRRLERY